MEQMVRFFLDTFSIMEMVRGNPKYKKYLGASLFTAELNLYELYYNLLKTHGPALAESEFFQFRQFIVDTKNNHIFMASKFKLANNKLNISYADALGYAIAKEEGMKFLTGDKVFEGIDNVEFVR